MRSKSINFETTSRNSVSSDHLEARRQQLKQWLHQCRQKTLALFESIDYDTFCCQAHPEFSPVGWHLGHIAYTEALWLLEREAGMPRLFPEFRRLFVADGLPKQQRVNLPTLAEVRHYLDAVREQVWHQLEVVDLNQQERLWRWIIQHESQHSETIAFVLQLQHWQTTESQEEVRSNISSPLLPPTSHHDLVEIPAGCFEQGNDSIDALDNERPVHQVELETYWIDRYPVTCRQYRAFMAAGGYQNPKWWSTAGWQWLQVEQVTQPLYWSDVPTWDSHPVCGISWYEAEAYTRFVGLRLPTEAEWEKAASWDLVKKQRRTYPRGETISQAHRCNHDNIIGHTTPVGAYPAGQSAYGCHDLLGNVWEWTASVFCGYEGFNSYPYPGYSQVYFDGQHQVLKGGSWATRPWSLRASFRNWYHPGVRQILAGFRCASSKLN